MMHGLVAGMVFVTLVSACDDDSKGTDTGTTRPDAAGDTAEAGAEEVSPDVAETRGDSTPSDTSAPDIEVVQGHGTVAGTHLEGIAVEVPAGGLQLCSGWNENASLADEKARKVRIVIGGKATSTLDEDALRAPLTGVVVESSPMRADRVTVVSEATSSPSFTLQGGGAQASTLYASIEHHLGGAGVLTESYYVSRTPEDRRPVVFGPDGYDMRFTYQGVDGALAPTVLERCNVGQADAEDAVTLYLARAPNGGKTWAALLRYWRTTETDAGSAPSTVLGHRLVHSDDPYFSTDAWGFWSATYSAQHHNHDETVEADFTRDLGRWHTIFRAPDPQAAPITRVLAERLRSTGDATLTIERLGPTGATTEVLDIADSMFQVRVDATALKRTLTCDGGEVLAAGDVNHLFQMLFCPAGDTRVMVALVPVVWSLDIGLSGTRIEGDAIKVTDDGWNVTIGNDVLQIRPQIDGRYYAEVRRGEDVVLGSGELPYTLGTPPPIMSSPVFASNDTVTVAIGRLWAGLGVGKSQLWAPQYVEVRHAGKTYRVEAWDAMDYTNTHHNWMDVLVATTDDGTQLKWRTAFMEGLANEVTITGPEGEVILAPTKVP